MHMCFGSTEFIEIIDASMNGWPFYSVYSHETNNVLQLCDCKLKNALSKQRYKQGISAFHGFVPRFLAMIWKIRSIRMPLFWLNCYYQIRLRYLECINVDTLRITR
eukprot:353518_1